MGPCEPGQVGNEAAISSSFQVRWASHRGPAYMFVEVGWAELGESHHPGDSWWDSPSSAHPTSRSSPCLCEYATWLRRIAHAKF